MGRSGITGIKGAIDVRHRVNDRLARRESLDGIVAVIFVAREAQRADGVKKPARRGTAIEITLMQCISRNRSILTLL